MSDSIWQYTGEGDSFKFAICKCGAAVPVSSKEAHEEFHREIDRHILKGGKKK